MGASGSSSEIFNCSKLKRIIENGTLGLPPPEPLGPGGPDLHYFLLGDDAFALMPWLVKPYSRQLTRKERISNYRISRGRRVVEKTFGILVILEVLTIHDEWKIAMVTVLVEVDRVKMAVVCRSAGTVVHLE